MRLLFVMSANACFEIGRGKRHTKQHANILQARAWAIEDRTSPEDIPSDGYVRKLHREMFNQTWKWAGEYRRTEKNTGLAVHEIRDRLVTLCGDVRYWIENHTHPPDEIAIRFHH